MTIEEAKQYILEGRKITEEQALSLANHPDKEALYEAAHQITLSLIHILQRYRYGILSTGQNIHVRYQYETIIIKSKDDMRSIIKKWKAGVIALSTGALVVSCNSDFLDRPTLGTICLLYTSHFEKKFPQDRSRSGSRTNDRSGFRAR